MDRPAPIAPTTGKSCRRKPLRLALWMEADRMGWLLPALTPKRLRDAARRRAERAPAELREPAVRPGAVRDLRARCFRPDHPYHWPTIGEADDLHAASLDDARAFFSTLLPPGQRVAGHRRRHRGRRGVSRWPRSCSAKFRPGPAVTAGQCRRSRRAATQDRRSRIAWICRACIWRGRRRRSSRPAMPSSIWPPTCSPTDGRRVSIAA